MATYKQLLSEKDFLKVSVRARALAGNGTKLYAIYYKDQTLYFKTRSATDPDLVYTQRIELTNVTLQAILNCKTYRDVENLIKGGNIKVDCNCPAFLYWGYKYKAWKHGYGIEKETRRPIVRNPYERGYVCKHLYYVLQVFPYLTKTLATKFKNWAVEKKEFEDHRTSRYFGKYKVKTDLDKNEKITLNDSTEQTSQAEQISDTNSSSQDILSNNSINNVTE